MEFPQLETADSVKLRISDTNLLMDIVEWISTMEINEAHIIIPESDVFQIKQNFPLNALLAELIEQKKLKLYSREMSSPANLILHQGYIYHLVRLGAMELFVETSIDDEVKTMTCEEFRRILEEVDPVEFDIMAWSDLLTHLEEIVGNGARQEFERLIKAARIENLGALDDISAAIIAAAQSGALLNDLGKWAEEVGLASKATFSRKKMRLEDDGLIYTEKVPIEVGRPKLRLKLADDVNAVQIQGDNISVSRKDTRTEKSASNKADRSSESSGQTNRKEEGVSGGILADIEQEVKDAISSN